MKATFQIHFVYLCACGQANLRLPGVFKYYYTITRLHIFVSSIVLPLYSARCSIPHLKAAITQQTTL